MIGFIIWIVGVILTIKAVIEIMQWNVEGTDRGKDNLPQMLR